MEPCELFHSFGEVLHSHVHPLSHFFHFALLQLQKHLYEVSINKVEGLWTLRCVLPLIRESPPGFVRHVANALNHLEE